MQVSVVPFSEVAHLEETVQVLLRVREADPNYPPPLDVERGVKPFTEWLLEGKVIFRWVAVAGGKVVGHVAISDAHDYLLNFLSSTARADLRSADLCEVTKLFVDPASQRTGAGGHLLSHSLASAYRIGRIPALAVVAESTAARRLYSRSSLTELGTFEGIHGTNYVYINEDRSRSSE